MEQSKNITDMNLKTDGYYVHTRPEMLKYIAKDANKILDVGCGEGLFSFQLKQMFGAETWGIELNPKAGALAQTRLDKVFIGDLNDIIPTLPEENFNCIIFNDILEHLIDPYNALLSIKSKLHINGVIICSIPNVRYISNLKKLLYDKDWHYEDEGILDKTHLRFFTRKSIINMFNTLGFEILLIDGINPSKSKLLKLVNILLLGNLEDSKYLQFATVVKVK